MSGRSAKEHLAALKKKATEVADRVKDTVSGGDPADAPLGSGAADRARKQLQNRKGRLDKEIERQGG